MKQKLALEERAHLKAALIRLQPYLQRPLTQEENASRTSIIRDEIVPVRDQIIEIEEGFCHC